MIPTRIKITEQNIQILSPFNNETVVFTIWKEDYDRYRDAFTKSEQYEREGKELKRKYEVGV